ncbi:mediator of RNA polymerase II transcription subunit 19a-like [Rutidosis leptorrhynchoides]|uniref:mediator of RNA polymerase II transcription subunit 19a-like n=1 Tax=Rutidosis leptorrhynchoides TaxID=125765 RepID=UPI003A98D377
MDPESKKFGKGPKELTGAVDLIRYYKLSPHYEFFCKKSLPLSISDTHYLHHVVGDTEIRKGEGMQLDQLVNNTSFSRDNNTRIKPFDLEVLMEAFQLKESAPVELPSSEKGMPTIAGKSRSESKDKEKKHKKHKDKEHKKHKHRHKDRSKDKDKERNKDKSSHHDKKRKNDGIEDVNYIHGQKKTKHKSSKMDEIGAIKIAA